MAFIAKYGDARAAGEQRIDKPEACGSMQKRRPPRWERTATDRCSSRHALVASRELLNRKRRVSCWGAPPEKARLGIRIRFRPTLTRRLVEVEWL